MRAGVHNFKGREGFSNYGDKTQIEANEDGSISVSSFKNNKIAASCTITKNEAAKIVEMYEAMERYGVNDCRTITVDAE